MEKLKHGKKARPMAKVVWRLLLPYKGDALKTITTDNGSEFAEHVTKKAECTCVLCRLILLVAERSGGERKQTC